MWTHKIIVSAHSFYYVPGASVFSAPLTPNNHFFRKHTKTLFGFLTLNPTLSLHSMADDPPEHDLMAGVTVPIRSSSPFSATLPQIASPGEYHKFPATIAGQSPVVFNTTPVERKIARKAASGSGNEVRLTEKFLELFNKAPDSTLELSKAAEALKVPKRRLYDITSVLEGIGLIEKKLKNVIRWKRGIQEEANSELDTSVVRLKASIEDFVSKELELDEQMSEIQGWIKKFTEDENTQKLLFLTESELKGLPCFKNQTLFAVRAPQGTTLEVPDPDQGSDGTQKRYRFILRSNEGPTEVYLISKFEEDFSAAAENSMTGLVANEQSETVSPDDTNADDTDYWLSSAPEFGISDLWDLSRDPNLLLSQAGSCSSDPTVQRDLARISRSRNSSSTV